MKDQSNAEVGEYGDNKTYHQTEKDVCVSSRIASHQTRFINRQFTDLKA